jgi:NitT/TauT family transport system ATP-binding protein
MLIRIENVSKQFGRPNRRARVVSALENISLDVAQGEFVSVVGPSGCGKSTLIRLVSGLDMPTHGRVIFDGKDVTGPLPNMGMAFQHPTLLPWRTVFQNVMIPFELMGSSNPSDRERADAIIKMVGLDGFENHYPDQLSGGMQQRVGICRALVTDPKVLILDEPFAALDLLTRDEMAIELSRISQEQIVTTLFVTHSITEAVFLSDRVVVMSPRPGRIVRVLDVEVPRPRHVSIEESPVLISLVKEIKDLIYRRIEPGPP